MVSPELLATFTGLPESNSDFGKKQVVVHLLTFRPDENVLKPDPKTKKTADFEVFFPKKAKNHPYAKRLWHIIPGDQPDTPNWYYYWGQLVPTAAQAKREYSSNRPGGNSWDTWGTAEVDRLPALITIYDTAGDEYARCLRSMAHENQHVIDFHQTMWKGAYYDTSLDSDRDTLADAWEKLHTWWFPPISGNTYWRERNDRQDIRDDYERYTTWTESSADRATKNCVVDSGLDWAVDTTTNTGTNWRR